MTFPARVVLATIVLGCVCPGLQAQTVVELGPPGGLLTAQQVAAKMEEKNRERVVALREFEGSRVYHLEYHGPGGAKDAEMKVEMNFRAPDVKNFTVTSQEGSKLIIEHVFKKLIESEREALSEDNRRATQLTSDNYEFALLGREKAEDGDAYVLEVKPRTKNKFLYQGKIWVSATDFAVTRIEATPAKNPSFWVRKTQINHQYVKVGDFWLPAQNRTESQIQFGGRAILTVDYMNYRILSAAPLEASSQAGNSW
ncbi:MAG TPA: outer membrane lipoprotein-sorting protein [Candidatus Angelobacter sp.]|nr:outer membrane lipoprotein-sorting protein [Candidatus Angelobacter sp.]